MVHRCVNKLETRVTGLDCVFGTNQGVCVCVCMMYYAPWI